MAKIYGNRWKIVDNLGRGGQSVVFRVIDTKEEYQGEYALKRILNPNRQQRFVREIEAIKLLKHSNIISIIDHSALDAAEGNADKQYLVMPLAEGGDLASKGRVALYKDSIDSTLQIAKQIASALATAHSKEIIHRDVKPGNILFSGNGHEVWLTDFGICLLRNYERITEEGEIVGPRAFIAPELEDGSVLEATPAADIYSLGKVIYYALTGGTIIPREQILERPFSQVFEKGERHHLIQLLLVRMICSLQLRLQSMEEVIQELEKIDKWEQNARLLPLNPVTLVSIEQMQKRALDTHHIKEENAAARATEEHKLQLVVKSILNWLRSELTKTASYIGVGIIKSEVSDLTITNIQDFRVPTAPNSGYIAVGGLELSIEDRSNSSGVKHLLHLILCKELKINFTVQIGSIPPATPLPVRDLQLALIPYYLQTAGTRPPNSSAFKGYLTRKDHIGQSGGTVNIHDQNWGLGRGQVKLMKWTHVTSTFHSNISQCFRFKLSDWPTNSSALMEALSEALDVFVSFVKEGASTIGR